jgi:hypothetical protein
MGLGVTVDPVSEFTLERREWIAAQGSAEFTSCSTCQSAHDATLDTDISMAMHLHPLRKVRGRRTIQPFVIVDGTLRKPVLDKAFGLVKGAGFAEYKVNDPVDFVMTLRSVIFEVTRVAH